MTESLRLRVHGLSKRYGTVRALEQVDFELRAGEVMALLGENGAGKSTFVKVLAGLVSPDEGVIEIDGAVTTLHPSGRSQELGVAVVHQEFSSVPVMTVAENLMLGQRGTPLLWLPRRLRRRAEQVLAQVGLAHVDPLTPVEQLTVAEVQLLEVARLLVRDARIVIFDEPTAALTEGEIARVFEVIRGLVAENRSIVYVTHRLDEVFRLADRATVFRDGTSLPPRPTSELTVNAVIEMMLGRELQTMFPARTTITDEPMLDVEGVCGPGLHAPVSFRVRRGEILGLTGQLGSGASAAIQIVAARRPRTAGRIRVDGAEPAAHTPRGVSRLGVAYCSPDRKRDGIFATRSLRENLSAPWLRSASGRIGWVSSSEERRQVDAIAERFAIDSRRMASAVGNLSGGNQQKVAVGKWLGTEPRVLLLEEPTRGVDVGARAEIYASLRSLCASGLAIMVVSSDASEVLGLCDTIATFRRGELTVIAPHEEWTEERVAREVMHSSAAGAAA